MGKVIRIFLILVVIAAAFVGITYREKLVFFERTPPRITLDNVPKTIGIQPVTAIIDAHDDGAGIDQVIVRLGKEEILNTSFKEWKNGHVTVPLELNGKVLGIKEGGKVDITVRVFDKSFFSNGSELSFEVTGDFIRPRAEVVSIQHNGFAGGSLLVFYKHLSPDII
jgi:hypothetical protein